MLTTIFLLWNDILAFHDSNDVSSWRKGAEFEVFPYKIFEIRQKLSRNIDWVFNTANFFFKAV